MKYFLTNASIGLSLAANKSSTIYTHLAWFIFTSVFRSFYLPLTGEDKNIMTSVNLTMCKAPLKMLLLWKTF